MEPVLKFYIQFIPALSELPYWLALSIAGIVTAFVMFGFVAVFALVAI